MCVRAFVTVRVFVIEFMRLCVCVRICVRV